MKLEQDTNAPAPTPNEQCVAELEAERILLIAALREAAEFLDLFGHPLQAGAIWLLLSKTKGGMTS